MSHILIIGKCSDTESIVSKWKADFNESPETVLLFGVVEDDILAKDMLNIFMCTVKQCVYKNNTILQAIYQLKCDMDKTLKTKAMVCVSSNTEKYVKHVISLLFQPIYTIFVFGMDNITLSNDVLSCPSVTNVLHQFLKETKFNNEEQVHILQSKIIPDYFVHGYSSRSGGLSSYLGMASLNLCYSQRKMDTEAIVNGNRFHLSEAAKFDLEHFHVAKAVHGKDVWVYEEEEPICYDAIITKTSGVTVAAPGADCNMIILADPVTKSCAAAHAGWKGMLKGIVKSTVSAMVQKYGSKAQDIVACIGPSLSSCCCEFGLEGVELFSPINPKCIVWKKGFEKPFLDLRIGARTLLENEGVPSENIDDGSSEDSNLAICTKCDPQKHFFSFRRDGPQFGNQVGFIGLKIATQH